MGTLWEHGQKPKKKIQFLVFPPKENNWTPSVCRHFWAWGNGQGHNVWDIVTRMNNGAMNTKVV
jgi:hypothetical protein